MARAGGLGGFLVIVAIVFGLKFYNKSEGGEEMLQLAHEAVRECDAYSTAPEYIDGLVDWAHTDAFEASFEMGWGRRQESTIYVDVYFDELFTRIIDRCREDRQDVIADSLEAMLAEVEDEGEG